MASNYPVSMSAADLFHVGSLSGQYTCPTCNTEFGDEPRHIDTCAWCRADQCPSCESSKCVGEGCHARICEGCASSAPVSVTEEMALCPKCAAPEVELKTVIVRGVAA